MSLTSWRWASGIQSFALACSLAVFGIQIGASGSMARESVATSDMYLQAGSGHIEGPFVGTYSLQTIVGAQRFYDGGFTGTNAVMANIEAGYIWNGHESLQHVQYIPTSGALGEVDRHATWVGAVMGGRPGGANAGPYQSGMAPDAQLFSGAVATEWIGSRYTTGFVYNSGSLSTMGPYRAAFMTGIAGPGGTRPADVINSSWTAATGVDGNDPFAGTIDALANQNPRTLMVLAAGNTFPFGDGPNVVTSPASGYNTLTVAALAPHGGAFDMPSAFSNGGPNDYNDPNRGTISAVRQLIDIAAPGENFATAYYGGQTGGNGPSLSPNPDGPAGGPDWYTRNISGTSFSAPTVAGGATLLYDAAYARFGSDPDARDSRVIKAVLMNSAQKTLGWNNGQVANPNGSGGVITSQGLDNRVGAGRMDLSRAFDQFLGGTTDVPGTGQGLLGTVNATGWDFGLVTPIATNDYLISANLRAGTPFTATLTWFRNRSQFGSTFFHDDSYDNLDLELWKATGGTATELISESDSPYNNTEHFSFNIPATGQYLLRVRWTAELFHRSGIVNNNELYGLAWSGAAVPEPASIIIVSIAASLILLSRVRTHRGNEKWSTPRPAPASN